MRIGMRRGVWVVVEVWRSERFCVRQSDILREVALGTDKHEGMIYKQCEMDILDCYISISVFRRPCYTQG